MIAQAPALGRAGSAPKCIGDLAFADFGEYDISCPDYRDKSDQP
jgi:hypothetical protein